MKPRIHFESVRRSEFSTITTTLCNRMVADGGIKRSQFRTDVTCKFCLKLLANMKWDAA